MASKPRCGSSFQGAVHRLAQQYEGLTNSNVKSRSFSLHHLSSYNFTTVPSSPNTGHPSSDPNFNRLTRARPIEQRLGYRTADSGNYSLGSSEFPTSPGRTSVLFSNSWIQHKSTEDVFDSDPLHRPTERRNSLGLANGCLQKTYMTSSVGLESSWAETVAVVKSQSNYYQWKSMASCRENERKQFDDTNSVSRGIGGSSRPIMRVQTVFNPQWGLQGSTTTVRRRDPALIDENHPRLLFPQRGDYLWNTLLNSAIFEIISQYLIIILSV